MVEVSKTCTHCTGSLTILPIKTLKLELEVEACNNCDGELVRLAMREVNNE